MIDVEAIRRAHRPGHIATLFVRVKVRASQRRLLLSWQPLMTQIVMSAIEESLPGQGTIASFKANGWYLDDLSITPINDLRGKARRDACFAARENLAERIAKHKPLAIVSLMLGIREDVEAAMAIAGCDVMHINTPFPGMGQQQKHSRLRAAAKPNSVKTGSDPGLKPRSPESVSTLCRPSAKEAEPPHGL